MWTSCSVRGAGSARLRLLRQPAVEQAGVEHLGDARLDMLASDNYAELIYDGDGSEFGFAGPSGSGQIEQVFQSFLDKRGEYTERIPFDGRSDYDPFTTAGIPAGGLFTGAEEHKTTFQQ